MSSASSELDTHTRTYLAVFGALAILTVVTVTVGYLSLPVGAAIVVALSIAGLKGALVASFFMRLKNSHTDFDIAGEMAFHPPP